MSVARNVRLPRINPGQDVRQYLNDFVSQVELTLNRLAEPSGGAAYTTANVTATRTIDPTTATLTTVANAVATMIQDLQSGSVLPQ